MERGGAGEAFGRQWGLHLDSGTVTHMRSHTSLFCTAVGATGVIAWCG